MTKEEILKLHTMSEEDYTGWLYDRGVFKNRKESLADCAFRMRDEVFKSNAMAWYDVWEWEFFKAAIPMCVAAKPIHWIQAALLAKLETETT